MATGVQRDRAKDNATELHLSELAIVHRAPCVSAFMSSDPNGSTQRDLARLQELLESAQANLGSSAVTIANVQQGFESQLRILLPEGSARSGPQGLALFGSGDFFCSRHLRKPIPDRVVTGSNFFIRPLLAIEAANDRFFLLALSLKHVRLFEGSRLEMRELTLIDVPELLRQDIEGHSFEKQLQFHSSSPAAGGKRGDVFHGVEPDTKERILHFFRGVNESVAHALKGLHAPLVIASVDYLHPIYKAVNTYPALMENGVVGSPEYLEAAALHTAAWNVVEGHLGETRERALTEYRELINTERTSSNLRKVLVEAERGRIRYLFLPPETMQWGSFAPPETVHVHSQQEPGDDELLNLAAVLTIRNRGNVYEVPPKEFREGAEVAALFRF